MNRVVLMGRLTRDPDIRTTAGQNPTTVARYTLAVDRWGNGADFIPCVAFGKRAEFCGKYLHKGSKICIAGHIQTGSYVNRDNQKVYTTDVVVEDQEFAESKSAEQSSAEQPSTDPEAAADGFMEIPDDITDDELPFN